MIKTGFRNIKFLRRKNNVVYYLISMNGVALSRQQFKEKMDGCLYTIKGKTQKIIFFFDLHYYEFTSIIRKMLENLRLNYLICGIGEIFGDQIKNDKSAKIPLGCFLIGTQLLNKLYLKLVKKYT